MDFVKTVQSIDFSSVGATNVLPLDIKDAVVKEKLSIMLYEKIRSSTGAPHDVLKYSEFTHLLGLNHQLLRFTVKVFPLPLSIIVGYLRGILRTIRPIKAAVV